VAPVELQEVVGVIQLGEVAVALDARAIEETPAVDPLAPRTGSETETRVTTSERSSPWSLTKLRLLLYIDIAAMLG